MAKVLVTGGSGKLGRAVLKDLVANGYDVLNIDQTLELDHFWDNQLAVGVVMLMLAAMTGSMSRAGRQSSYTDDAPDSSGRRIY